MIVYTGSKPLNNLMIEFTVIYQVWILLVFLLVAPIMGDVLTSEERAWLACRGNIIRLAPDPYFPPLEFFDDQGQYCGLIADYFQLIAQRLNIHIEYIRLNSWDDVIRQARDKKIDGITAAQLTPDRQSYLLYTHPLMDIPNVIILPQENTKNYRLEEMKDLTIVLTRGNAIHEYIDQNFPYLKVHPVENDLTALFEVSFKRADATVVNLAIASYLIERYGITNLRLGGDSGRKNILAIATRRDLPILNKIMDKGLYLLQADEMKKIYDRWISIRAVPFYRSRIFWQYTGIISGLIFLALGAVVMWNRTLSHKVREQTDELRQELKERHKVEQALRESESTLLALLNSPADLLIVFDLTGHIVRVNRTLQVALDLNGVETLSKSIDQVFSTALVTQLYKKAGEIYTTVKPSRFEHTFHARQFDWVVYPITDWENRVVKIAVVARDITELKHYEQEIFKIQRLESLGVLAGGIAHDFNNFLTALLGNITMARTLMKEEYLKEKISNLLSDAEKAIDRAKGMTYQLLTFAKGGIPVKQVLRVNELLDDSIHFVLSGSNIICETHYDENLRLIEADGTQLAQVFNNIILNARQAMPDGGKLDIRAKNIFLAENNLWGLIPGEYIFLEFIDQGCGIDPHVISKIFDPFYTTKDKGHGLGLSSAYSIIEKHGGIIQVQSELNIGTSLHIFLYVEPNLQLKPETTFQFIAGGDGKILVMDDDELILATLKEILEHYNYQVKTTLNGEQVLEAFSQDAYDLVILDLTIPGGMGGKEVMKYLLELNPEVNAIVSSGYSNDPIMAEYDLYGFKGCIPKPYRVDQLLEVIEQALHG